MIEYSAIIQSELDGLTPAAQQQVLALVRSLKSSDTPGSIADLAGTISRDDLETMKTAIHDDCEQVDAEDWSE